MNLPMIALFMISTFTNAPIWMDNPEVTKVQYQNYPDSLGFSMHYGYMAGFALDFMSRFDGWAYSISLGNRSLLSGISYYGATTGFPDIWGEAMFYKSLSVLSESTNLITHVFLKTGLKATGLSVNNVVYPVLGAGFGIGMEMIFFNHLTICYDFAYEAMYNGSKNYFPDALHIGMSFGMGIQFRFNMSGDPKAKR